MTNSSVPDNELILQRASDSCRDLDDLRYRLHTIQKRLAKTREPQQNPSSSTPSFVAPLPTRDEVLTNLLHEAYTLQFQISTLLSATEEPIPERERIQKQPRKETAGTTQSTRHVGAEAAIGQAQQIQVKTE